MSFESLNLDPRLLKLVEAQKFEKPTPIQAKAIPSLLKGHDLIGLAQTGTGKTAAFVLPILHDLINEQRVSGVQALIVTPTRELAEQIHQAVLSLSKGLNLKSVSVYGGVNINSQLKKLRAKADIVVACPGRLLDHINRKTIKLHNLQTLVLDEADQMLDMGFFPDIKRIVATLPEDRQTIMFSATMPKDIEKLASEILYKPKKVQVDKREVTKQVQHSVFHVRPEKKQDLLQEVIATEQTHSTLVFTRTKHRARQLTKKLSKAGFKTAELHGNLSINQRKRSVDGFKSGRYAILVATDVAARGIDISGISHVINFDVPVTPEIYIHRLGRTGRAAQSGVAYTFAAPDELQLVKRIERVIKQTIPVTSKNGQSSTSKASRMKPEPETKSKSKNNSKPKDKSSKKAKDELKNKTKRKSKPKRTAGNKPKSNDDRGEAKSSAKRKSKAKTRPGAKPSPNAKARTKKPKAKHNQAGKSKTRTKSKSNSQTKPKAKVSKNKRR